VDAKGCPVDTDGDGVADGIDQCPATPAGLKVDVNGCPIEVSEKETQLLDTGMIRLQNINFDTNKASLKPESFPVLDEVAAILLQYPALNLEIGGHTDNTGTKVKNVALSEARAKSVLNYLLQKYPTLDGSKFTTVGYGPMVPVAPNGTALGRAKNRRVEFKVTNADVLKIEREKRRFLKKDEGAPADSTK
jgi:OOP family OmpA-OmpF porin